MTEMNHNTLKVAAVQMVSTADVDANLVQAEELVQQASNQGAKLVLLPENFAVFNANRLHEWSQPERSEYLESAVQCWAKKYNVWIIAGTLPKGQRYPNVEDSVSENRVRTSCIVVSPQGKSVDRYDKIHLFDVDVDDAHGAYRESETIEPGTDVLLADVPVGNLPGGVKVGLSVCYDLRFPELYRMLATQGARVLTVPAAFTWETGKAHWEVLLRARAIENQCYVIASNQGGQHTASRKTWGHSMIIDPWGKVLNCIESGPGVIVAELNFAEQDKLRKQMPVLQHTRL